MANNLMLLKNWQWISILTILLLALILRGWKLSDSGLQNDEQIWHERSIRFIQSFLGPIGPKDLAVPKVYWPIPHVDLSSSTSLSALQTYPFTIKMEAIHPGTPIGFLIGLFYLFLATGSSSWSLEWGSIIEVARYPGVILGTLWVGLIYWGGRQLVGYRAALFAAMLMAVEPLIVGSSRLARLDLSVAVWSTAAFFSYVLAQQRNQKRWAVLAGIGAGLALATNPYGVLLIPAFAVIKVLYSQKTGPGQSWYFRWLPNQLDWILVISWGLAYISAYPNLWPNPIWGLYQMVQMNINLPHAQGEASNTMPVSHWFYLIRSPEHVLPWTLGLALIGLGIGLSKQRREVWLLIIWGGSVLFLLSLPAGRKNLKNFLLVMPSIFLLAGIGLDVLVGWLSQNKEPFKKIAIMIALSLVLLGAGLWTTVNWWPYPQTYTWPWQPDPQTLSTRELVGEGEGIKEAIAYIQQHGPPQARIGCFTGENNAAYYYESALLGSPTHPDDLKNYDWLLVLPKLTFGSSSDHPLVHWVQIHKPTHIIYEHQIELVRLYRLEEK